MDRRDFVKTVALLPLMVGLDPQLVSEQCQAEHTPAPQGEGSVHQHKSDQEYNRHRPIDEREPFEGPLLFTREELKRRLEPFALNEVTLQEGPFAEARDLNRSYMLRLPNERLLHSFRITAGISSTAEPLGGWESPSSELRGHFVGHYISACALLFASTSDRRIKEKADELVAAIAECQTRLNLGGYVSAFPVELFDRLDRREKVWAPFYTLHKILAGLLDMKTYAGNEQALSVATNLAGWVDTWTAAKSETHMQEILATEFGGMNEVLYNLADVTSDDRWARVGDRFTKKRFFNPLAQSQDELKGLHVNTHVPQVIGAARRYELSSDDRFRNVAEFFWDAVVSSRTYATGGTGNTESWLTNANRLALEMNASSHHQECCCSYNMMKLTQHLYQWSGDPRFVDYYERNLLNHRLGTIEPNTGHTAYFLSVSKGAWKTTCTEDQTFWCCTGTAMEDFARLNDFIYCHDGSNIYVNLLASSELHWKSRGISLRQQTDFPDSQSSILTVERSPEETWIMHIRVPAWTTPGFALRINGESSEVACAPGSYVAIKRAWRRGDRVELTIPMRLTAEPLPDDPSQQAFLFGPLVLAAQFPKHNLDSDLLHKQGPELEEAPECPVPMLQSNRLALDQMLKREPSEPLTFRHQFQDILFKPLNQSWDRFGVYFTVS